MKGKSHQKDLGVVTFFPHMTRIIYPSITEISFEKFVKLLCTNKMTRHPDHVSLFDKKTLKKLGTTTCVEGKLFSFAQFRLLSDGDRCWKISQYFPLDKVIY